MARALDGSDARNTFMVFPEDFTPKAFWLVDNRNGSTSGILPNITGGASEAELTATLKRTERAINIIVRAGTMLGGSGAALGAFATLEKTKARLLINAAIMIATMTAREVDWGSEASKTGCGLAKAAGSRVPGLGPTLTGAGAVIRAVGTSGGGIGGAISGC